jgi:hypothetical protein
MKLFLEFPWMTALLDKALINGPFKNSYKCGGSLIAKNVVLTGNAKFKIL